MLLSTGFVKPRSLALSSLVLSLAAASAGAMTAGCIFVRDHGHDDDVIVDDPQDPVPDDPAVDLQKVSIDPDQILSAVPGEGVGIFVEYRSEGIWHVWTTCDTFVSKAVCSFNMFASFRRAEEVIAYSTDELEGQDSAVDLGNGEMQFTADTDSDTDGFVIEAVPGASLTLETYLDGGDATAFVTWVGDGVLHQGTPYPALPVEFLPPAAP